MPRIRHGPLNGTIDRKGEYHRKEKPRRSETRSWRETRMAFTAGTVIDAYTQGEVTVDLVGRGTYPTINLAGFTQSAMTVEVLYDQLEGNDNPKWFDLLIRTPLDAPAEFVIDTINGNSVRPIDLQILTTTKTDDGKAIRALAEIKPLAKKFRKGINTFEVAYGSSANRVAAEVVLNIQF